jgi:hypothetical protein
MAIGPTPVPRIARRAKGRAAAAALAVAVGGLLLAACGSSNSAAPPTTSTTTTVATTGAQNLTVTPAVRTALLAAGAATHGLPVADFTGLVKGTTFYAYDSATGTYWAGAALTPIAGTSAAAQAAQVSVQDDGGYVLYTMPAGGSWTGYNDGLGEVPGSHCAIVTPTAVRKVWSWSLTTPCGGPPS